MTVIRSQIIGCGAYLPETILTNARARQARRHQRRVDRRAHRHPRAPHRRTDGEKTSDLAFEAARAALARCRLGGQRRSISSSAPRRRPTKPFRPSRRELQARLGMTRGAAFDVQAVCSGFIYALAVADNFIRGGQAQHRSGGRRREHVAAARLERPHDLRAVRRRRGRGGADGAGRAHGEQRGPRRAQHQALFGRTAARSALCRRRPVLDADHRPSAHARQGSVPSRRQPTSPRRSMASLDNAGLEVGDIDWFVPHQANQRILDGTAKKAGHCAAEAWSPPSPCTATHRPPPCRWPWPPRSATAASSGAIWCCWRRWAAAYLGRRPAALVAVPRTVCNRS